MNQIRVIQTKCGYPRALARREACLIGSGMLGVDASRLRLAYTSPSGRPALLLDGRASSLNISLSHLDHHVGIAVDDCSQIGIDLVNVASARGLQTWAGSEKEGVEDDSWPAFGWAAREAAFKALSLDRLFVPDEFEVKPVEHLQFIWRFVAPGYHHVGVGKFMIEDDDTVCAVAWNQREFGDLQR